MKEIINDVRIEVPEFMPFILAIDINSFDILDNLIFTIQDKDYYDFISNLFDDFYQLLIDQKGIYLDIPPESQNICRKVKVKDKGKYSKPKSPTEKPTEKSITIIKKKEFIPFTIKIKFKSDNEVKKFMQDLSSIEFRNSSILYKMENIIKKETFYQEKLKN